MSNPDILTPKLTAAPVRFEIGHTHTPISGEHGGKSECAPRAHAPAPARPAVLSCSARRSRRSKPKGGMVAGLKTAQETSGKMHEELWVTPCGQVAAASSSQPPFGGHGIRCGSSNQALQRPRKKQRFSKPFLGLLHFCRGQHGPYL